RYDLAGRRVVVTAGGTREPIDPVRFISNYSSGKMGFALAAAAADRGAKVTLITTANHPEHNGIDVQRVDTAEEMLAELRSQLRGSDLLLMAAAVGDFRPSKASDRKIRREETPSLTLELEPIPDVVASLAAEPAFATVFRVGFAAEDSKLDAKAMEKVKRKGLQAIVANDISRRDIGFGSEDPGVETKAIATAGREPLLLPHQVALARLVADHYWLPLIECIRAMLPPRVRGSGSAGSGESSRQRRHTRLLELATGPAPAAESVTLTDEQRAALDVIDTNPVTLLHG